MPRPVPDLTDRVFGRLVAKEQAGWLSNGYNARMRAWRCHCDPAHGGCGRSKRVAAKHLQYGRTRSCGCLKRDQCVAMGNPLRASDGTLYPSTAAACRALGVDKNAIGRRLDLGWPIDTPLRHNGREVVAPDGTRHPTITAAATAAGLWRCRMRRLLADPASGWRRA